MAANIGGIVAGGAFVKLMLDSAELNKGLAEAQSRMKRFVAAVNGWGAAVTLNTAVLQAPFKAAFDSFAEFDLKMRQVQAVTSATGQQFVALTAQARKLGRETSFTTDQVSDAMVALGRLGFTAAEVQDSVRPVMNLARATGNSLGDAAMVAGNNMRIFGLETKDMVAITDLITTSVNRSAQTLQDFAEASSKAGPNFVNTGMDIKEMAASMGILANMGIRGSLAGTALSRSIKQLAKANVQDLLKSYGVEVQDAEKKMRPLHQTLQDIARVMNSMSHAERIRFAEKIFEVRGSLAGLPLTTNSKAIEDFIVQLRNCGGAGEQFATTMEGGVWGSVKLLESAVNDLAIEIGKLFSQSFDGWIKGITDAINAVTRCADAWEAFATPLVQVGGALMGVGVILKALVMMGGAIKAIFQPLSALNAWLVNAAAKAELAAKAVEMQGLRAAESSARAIAADKARAAAEIKNSADIAKARLKEQKALEDAAEKEFVQNRRHAKDLNVKVAKTKEEYAKRNRTDETDYSRLKRERETLWGDLRSQKTEWRDARDKAEGLQAKAKRLQWQAKKAEKDVDEAQRRLDAGKGYNAGTEALRKQSDDAHARVDALRAEYEAASNAKNKAAGAFETATQNKTQWKQRVSKHKGRLAKLEKDKNDGKKSAPGLFAIESKRGEYYRTGLETSKSEYKKAQLELDDKEKYRKKLGKQLFTAERNATELDRKLSRRVWRDEKVLAATVNGKTQEAAEAAEKAQMAGGNAIRGEQEANALQKRVKDTGKDIVLHDKGIKGLGSRIDAARAQYEDKTAGYNTEISAANAEAVTLKAKYREAQAARSQAQQEYEKVQREAQKAAEEAKRAKAKADEIAANAQKLAYEGGATPAQQKKYAQVIADEQTAYDRRREAKKTLAEKQRQQNELMGTLAPQRDMERKDAEGKAALFEKERRDGAALIASSKQRLAIANQEHALAVANNAELQKRVVLEEQALQSKLKDAIDNRNALPHADGTGNRTQRKPVMLADKEIAGIQRELEVRKQANAATLADSQNAIASTEAKIAVENQYQAELLETLRIKKGEAASAIGKYGQTTRVVNTGNGVVGKAARAEADANKAYASAMAKRMQVEKECLTVNQRWANAWANRSQTMGGAIAFETKYAKAVLKTSMADMVRGKQLLFSMTAGKAASAARVAGYYAEAAAAKVAAAATMLLKTAFDWICANPITAVLLALTGVYALAERAARKAAQAFNEVAEAHRIEYENLKEKTSEMEKEFDTTNKYIDYLKALENAQALTADQQNTAMKIIEWLNGKYGDLGITIDGLSGRLEGAANAQQLLNEKMLEAARIQARGRLNEAWETATAGVRGIMANAKKNSGFFARLTIDGVSDEWAEVLKAMGFDPGKWMREQFKFRQSLPPGVYWSDTEWEKWQDKHSIFNAGNGWGSSLDWGNIANFSDTQLEEARKLVKAGLDKATAKGLDATTLQTLHDAIKNMIAERNRLLQMDTSNLSGENKDIDVSDAPKKALEPEEAKKLEAELEEQDRASRLKKASETGRTIAALEKERDGYLENAKALQESAEAERNNAMGNDKAARNRIEEAQKKVAALNEEISELQETQNKEALTSTETERLAKLTQEEVAQQAKIAGLLRDRDTYAKNLKAAEENVEKWTTKIAEAKERYAKEIEEEQENARRRIANERREKESLTQVHTGYWNDRKNPSLMESFNKSLEQRYEGELYQQLMQDKNFFGAMQMMVEAMNANSVAIQNATNTYNGLLNEAKNLGYYDGTMNPVQKSEMDTEISRLASLLQEYNNRHLSLRQQYEEAVKASMAPQDRQLQSTGSFSAKALSRNLNADTYYARVVKIGETTQLNTSQILQYVQSLFQQQRSLNARLGVVQ